MTTSVYHTAYARHVKNVGFAFVIPVAYRNPQCLRASGVLFWNLIRPFRYLATLNPKIAIHLHHSIPIFKSQDNVVPFLA